MIEEEPPLLRDYLDYLGTDTLLRLLVSQSFIHFANDCIRNGYLYWFHYANNPRISGQVKITEELKAMFSHREDKPFITRESSNVVASGVAFKSTDDAMMAVLGGLVVLPPKDNNWVERLE